MELESQAGRAIGDTFPFWKILPVGFNKRAGGGFWRFFAVAFFFNAGFSVYLFLFNLYLLDFHFNERAIGLLAGAMTLGSLAGTLPAGLLARKIAGEFALFQRWRGLLPKKIVLRFLPAFCGIGTAHWVAWHAVISLNGSTWLDSTCRPRRSSD